MRGGKKKRLILVIGGGLLAIALTVVTTWFLSKVDVTLFEPKGVIAEQERSLMVTALLMSLIVVVPVYVMTIFIVWKYRAGNKKAKYNPDWDRNRAIEAAWWLIPFILIFILSIIAWNSSHALDPFKPIESKSHKKPLTIQVVALQWKWLFIYPEQKVASVNFLQFPTNTPLKFQITSDGPMNSFWIPKLGGQVYAMSGMSTQLHLQASEAGDYRGSSANISGEGFSGMRFTARASSEVDFKGWVHWVKNSPNQLNEAGLKALAKPSLNNPRAFYILADDNLYNKVVMQYMSPSGERLRQDQHQQRHRDYEAQP